ncbi:C-type lectin 11 isoform X1 [Bombyx mori]|uniref:C-type lectin 11 isoform X1 n=1 Tax=Bombyx mori TaxID=7091 RepID=UPI002ED44967
MKSAFICFCFLAIASAPPPSVSKQYRSDYVYNKDTNAFYKLHTDSAKIWDAKSSCTTEGAQLMVPASEQDIIQLHSMFKRFPDLGNYVWVDEDGKDHESAEEQPMIDLSDSVTEAMRSRFALQGCDVVTRQGEIETSPCYNRLPFICKVEAIDAPYDTHCGVFAIGYQYVESTGSCYKISKVAYSWNQAYDECQAENAHLVVLNSEAEMLVVKNLTNAAAPVDEAQTTYFFYAGFRAQEPTKNETPVFKTIFSK